MPTVIEITEAPDPARCCEQLAGLSYRLFLDSATPGARLGRYSFLTADPIAVVRSKGSRTECLHAASSGWRDLSGDVLAEVGALLQPQGGIEVGAQVVFQLDESFAKSSAVIDHSFGGHRPPLQWDTSAQRRAR